MKKRLLLPLVLVFVLAVVGMVVSGCSMAGSGTIRGSQEFTLSVNFDGMTDPTLVQPGRFTLTDRQGNGWISAKLFTVATEYPGGDPAYAYLGYQGTYKAINQNGRTTGTGTITVWVRIGMAGIDPNNPPKSAKWDKWISIFFDGSGTAYYTGPIRTSITSWGTPPTTTTSPPTTS